MQPYESLIECHSKVDTVASAAVLHGVLNTVLWHFVKAGVGRQMIFEELCNDPISTFVALFKSLDLSYDDSLRKMHETLCFGEVRPIEDYRPHAVARNSKMMADSWKKQLSMKDVEQIMDIWRKFDIPLYRSEEEWFPSHRLAT